MKERYRNILVDGEECKWYEKKDHIFELQRKISRIIDVMHTFRPEYFSQALISQLLLKVAFITAMMSSYLSPKFKYMRISIYSLVVAR